MIQTKNFKCEDCGGDKFTVIDRFDMSVNEFKIHCATKDCEASYDFRPVMKLSSSSHPTKICECNQGFLSRTDKFCSGCGIKNPGFKEQLYTFDDKDRLVAKDMDKITDADLDVDDDEVDELLMKNMKGGKEMKNDKK